MWRKFTPCFILCFILCLLFSTGVFGATTGKIAGKIRDAGTGETLPGVNVIIQDTNLGAATDLEGDYYILNVSPGTYTLNASMMGYEAVNKTEVFVSVDRTITVNFSLKPTVIEGQQVTVVAEKEVIPMDVSASVVVAEAAQIDAVPVVTDVTEFINLQAGIENDIIRGGGLDQTQFMMNGLSIVDNYTNKPMMMVNLSSVKEVNIIKGGFNAEYGNVRSGLINVITKEASPAAYHGTVDLRISPAHQKHDGPSIFNSENYWLRSYLDPGVMWIGTEASNWDDYTKQQFPTFMGWNALSAQLLADQDPTNDRTPEQCRDMFLYTHTVEGSQALGQTEREYGNKPDWIADMSISGPVPVVGHSLGNLSFFASYRTNWEMFALPTFRDYYKDENAYLKLTTRLSPSMKLSLEGVYGEVETVASTDYWAQDAWFRDGEEILYSGIGSGVYQPVAHQAFDIYRNVQGLSFDHVLSPSTFYNFRISRTAYKNNCGPPPLRDTKILRHFGATPVDERPYGFWWEGGIKTLQDGIRYTDTGARNRDWSEIEVINARFDITSQVDKRNQFKAGFVFNYDDLDVHYELVRMTNPDVNRKVIWRHFPIRAGAYLQDKLEFEGMIANIGIRLDYNNPNSDWYTVERYSKFFKKEYKEVFPQLAPTEEATGYLKISPRLGVSHPISDAAKLYFNYGHFYSMAPSSDMYRVQYGKSDEGTVFIGNPEADLPRTVAYELGLEYNIGNLFLLHVAGYYKDVTSQTGSVGYQNYDGTVNYQTIENKNYADIRGIELQLDKRWGRWVTGWINYNYLVTTSGFTGFLQYYQDPRQQRLYGLENPYQERPLSRPYARANLLIASPNDFGPTVSGIKPLADIYLSLLFHYKSGRYETWDPLQTFKLQDNLHWKSEYHFDMRISKRMRFGRLGFSLFADINNLFNNQYLNDGAFFDGIDRENYLKSLKLPMYEGTEGAGREQYAADGMTAGEDKAGDVRSSDKNYINMPNLNYLTYLNVRSVMFGVKFDF